QARQLHHDRGLFGVLTFLPIGDSQMPKGIADTIESTPPVAQSLTSEKAEEKSLSAGRRPQCQTLQVTDPQAGKLSKPKVEASGPKTWPRPLLQIKPFPQPLQDGLNQSFRRQRVRVQQLQLCRPVPDQVGR